MPSVSQQEYDVTSYRNVLSQTKTAFGTCDEALKYIKAALASSIVGMSAEDNNKLSGFMMKEKGGKSMARWSEVVGPIVGVGRIRYNGFDGKYRAIGSHAIQKLKTEITKLTGYPNPGVKRIANRNTIHHSDIKKDYNIRQPTFSSQIQSKTYDLNSLMRQMNWELNRLRIEFPFDLRQLTNQLNHYANQMAYNDPFITAYKLHSQIKHIRDSVLPKMRKKLESLIKQAHLRKQVQEKTIQNENTKTIKKSENVAKQQDKQAQAQNNSSMKQANSLPEQQSSNGSAQTRQSSPGPSTVAVTVNQPSSGGSQSTVNNTSTKSKNASRKKKKSIAVPISIAAVIAVLGHG